MLFEALFWIVVVSSLAYLFSLFRRGRRVRAAEGLGRGIEHGGRLNDAVFIALHPMSFIEAAPDDEWPLDGPEPLSGPLRRMFGMTDDDAPARSENRHRESFHVDTDDDDDAAFAKKPSTPSTVLRRVLILADDGTVREGEIDDREII